MERVQRRRVGQEGWAQQVEQDLQRTKGDQQVMVQGWCQVASQQEVVQWQL